MRICLMGIDGAGKSTIGDSLMKELGGKDNCDVVWARYQPRLVKLLIAPFRKKNVKSSKDYNNMTANDYVAWTKAKKDKTKKHPILAKVLLWLQYLEYNSQIKGVLSDNNKSHLIVDRYVIDFIVDQTINYGDISKSVPVKRLLDKMHNFSKVFFINVDSEIAFKRKGDIPSLAYLDERRAIYMDYISKLPNAVCINNNGSIDDTMHEVKRVLGL